MDEIHVKFFNTPSIFKNNDKVLLPFRKAEALFYYLVVKKQATRDELVNLLWGSTEENIAKKNLRNTMYKIRKTLDLDVIISPQRHMVIINPDIPIASDLRDFLKKENEIDLYLGEFLQGFFLKDGEEFENWMFAERQHYKDIYIKRLLQQIDLEISKQNYINAEKHAKSLINEDMFDERGYRALMKIYKLQGIFNKAIDIYNKLEEVLEEELGISPDIKTQELLKEILDNKDNDITNHDGDLSEFFYGRYKELALLKKNYQDFIYNKSTTSILINGEAGIGKTKLKDKFLEKIDLNKIYILKSNCYQAEEEYIFKPWNTIFTQIAKIISKEKIKIPSIWKNLISSIFPVFSEVNIDNTMFNEGLDTFKYRVVEEAIIGLINKIKEKKKIVFVFEDLQWMDNRSLALLSSILLNNQEGVLLIGTCRDDYSTRIDEFITKLRRYGLIEEIYLPRFSAKEVEDFIVKGLPYLKGNNELLKKLYLETEGNTFFMMEYLNAIQEKRSIGKITHKMEDILKSRFFDISNEGKELLNIISLFFDKAHLYILQSLTNKDELSIINILEELQNKNIIKIIEDGERLAFQFTHQKLREFIYHNLSSPKKKLLHNRVGILLENNLKNHKMDYLNYSKLIYHFLNAGNKIVALKYTIKNIDTYLDVSHEFVPTVNDVSINKEELLYMNEEELIKQFDDIEEQLREIKQHQMPSEDIIKLEIEFYHIKGRYLIRGGEYQEGVNYIDNMIRKAETVKIYQYSLKGYRQMVNYCIQIHNTELMDRYVEAGLNLARHYKLKKDIGIFMRLRGLNRMMVGNYQEAEETLKQSIDILKEVNEMTSKYISNIAASYNYIGEIRRYTMKFSSALNYYDKAIKLCKEDNVMTGLMMFNTNAGQAALDMGDYERAKIYFEEAIKLYNELKVLWGRAIAEGYMSLLLVREGSYDEALNYLKRAEAYAEKLKNPYEIGILYRIKAEIKSSMKRNQAIDDVFYNYLDLNLRVYCEEGIKMLEKTKNTYVVDILKVLNKC